MPGPRYPRQPSYRWLASPVTEAELGEAQLANAVFDAHRDDPEFGYRFLADEVRQGGCEVCDRTVWRICQDNWSAATGRTGSGLKRVLKSCTGSVANLAEKRGMDERWLAARLPITAS